MLPPEPKKKVRVWPVLREYAGASAKYPGIVVLILLSSIIMQTVSVTTPLYLKQFIDILSANSVDSDVIRALFSIVAIITALYVAHWVGRNMHSIGVMRIDADVMADLANRAFKILFGHSYDFFVSNFAGSLTRRVTRFSRAYEQVFDTFATNIIPAALYIGGTVTVLYWRNHWLGLVLLVWVITFISLQLLMTRWRHPLRVARAAEDSRLTGVLSDAIGNHSSIKLFASETYEAGIFGSVVEAWRKATRRSWMADNWVQSAQQALGIIIEIGLMSLAIILWKEGTITVGDFILIQLYVLGVINIVWNIGNMFRRLYDAFADASEMIDIMETPYAIDDAVGAKALTLKTGKIEFDDVSFAFAKDRLILERFSLAIGGGEKIALVGPSGAGKSTVTKLLLRLYDVTDGVIRLDGQDIRTVTQESLHNAIAFVPQEPVLFHRTLKENIAYGKKDATEEEIREAARLAHCHEFISVLPDGYETYVGERGIKLSGGERQRIAIARAILKNAPVLVLDEATSSLDSESEALIQKALDKLMAGKTVIAIAHRLSTIMKMDQIVVMEGGKTVLSGTHAELLNQEANLYKKLWEIQAGGFIQDEHMVARRDN